MSSNLIMFDDVTVCEETLCILQRSLGPALTFICRCEEGKAPCKQPSDPLHEYIRGSSSAMFFGRHGAPGGALLSRITPVFSKNILKFSAQSTES